MRGTDPFQVLLLPYRKTAPRTTAVTPNGAGVQIAAGAEQTQVGNQSYAYTGNGLTILTTFGAQAAAANGIQISGGPTEVVINGARVTITAHGTAGTRQITVPGLGINYALPYGGGSPLKLTL